MEVNYEYKPNQQTPPFDIGIIFIGANYECVLGIPLIPATLALFGLGLAGLGCRQYRSKQAA